MWKNAVIILTCANRFINRKSEEYDEEENQEEKVFEAYTKMTEQWKTKITASLNNDVGLLPEDIEKNTNCSCWKEGGTTNL